MTGVPLSDLVNESTLAKLRAAADEPGDPETKAAAGMTTAPGGVASKRKRDKDEQRAGSGDDREYSRDAIGQFASGSANPNSGGRPVAGSGVARAKDDDEKDKPRQKRTADGGIDRDGDGDSDPALNAEGFAKIGDLDDLNRQVNNWNDNVPPAKRREQRIRMLARAAELGASDKMLARIRALPAPPPAKDRKDDMDPLEFKDEPASGLMEHKADTGLSGAQVLSADPETGIVEALVSVTGVEDKVKDIIEPGAYTKTLAERDPIGVWSHDDKTWVARTEERREILPGDPFFRDLKTMDGKPWPKEAGAVYVKARFNLETPHGAAAFSDVKFFEGKTGWSIGYRATKAARNVRTGVRRIKELDWFEFSPVMVGAASQPMTLSVKSMADDYRVDPDEAKGLFEEAYDELGADELSRLVELKAQFGVEVKARVRTAEGAEHYGQPIGSVIIPDAPSGNLVASSLKEGMSIEMRVGGGDDYTDVKGKITDVQPDGDGFTKVIVDGKQHRLKNSWPIRVTDGAEGNGGPVTDGDLVALIKEAEDDDERSMLRQAAALPVDQRRAFLTGRQTPKDADAPAGKEPAKAPAANAPAAATASSPAAPAQSPAAKRFEGQKMTAGNAARVLKQTGLDKTHEAVPEGDGSSGMVRIQPKGGKAPDKGTTSAPAAPAAPKDSGSSSAPSAGGGDKAPPAGGGAKAPKKGDQVKVGGREAEVVDVDGDSVTVVDHITGKRRTVKPSELSDNADGKYAGPNAEVDGKVVRTDKPAAPAKPAASGGFKEPANDKGETVSDFVNATIDEIRDQEYRQMESDVQAALDRWKAKPNSGTTSDLIRVLSGIDEDGIDGEKIDDAIDLLEELLKSAAYGGRGRTPQKKADPEPPEVKGSRASLDRSPRKNWVEMRGGLPGYFREVARSISEEHAIPLDRAIPMAIGRIKTWARGGGNVKPDTIAKAAAAVAQWTKMKTQKGFEFDSELLEDLEAKGWLAVEVYEGLVADGVEAKHMLFEPDAEPALEPEPAEVKGDVEVLEPELLARAGEVKTGWWEAEADPTVDFAELVRRRQAMAVD